MSRGTREGFGDAAIVNTLLGAHRALADRGRRLTVQLIADNRFERPFQIARLAEEVAIAVTRDAAVALVSRREPGPSALT